MLFRVLFQTFSFLVKDVNFFKALENTIKFFNTVSGAKTLKKMARCICFKFKSAARWRPKMKAMAVHPLGLRVPVAALPPPPAASSSAKLSPAAPRTLPAAMDAASGRPLSHILYV